MFSSINAIVLAFMVRSVIHLKSNFFIGVMGSGLSFPYKYPVLSNDCMLLLKCLSAFTENQLTIGEGLFCDSVSCSIATSLCPNMTLS